MEKVQVQLPPKLVDVFLGPAMYRGARGGRGSAKTRSFAKMAAVAGYRLSQAGETGVIVCGREFMNSLDESSLAEVKLAIESEPWLAEGYEIGDRYVRTRDGKIDFAFVGLRHNLASIKSKARIWVLWVDEAERVSETAWQIADNTVREEANGFSAETWATWNPERKGSPTDLRWRQHPPPESKIVELNWRDNPWFPNTLEKKRQTDLLVRPDQYAHIWEGDYVTVIEGAYFARDLVAAKEAGRIGRVAADPLMTYRAVFDIGGTGAKADAVAIWIMQWVGREIRCLDYYEAVGQPLATHVAWLRDHGYGKALCILPHDGSAHDKVFDVSYDSALRSAEFEVQVIPNQGRGAAKMRIEAARRLFPSIWFNEATTQFGRDALGWYHEKKDAERGIGLGPEHDWASHGADAFGLGCVAYEAPRERKRAAAHATGAHGWLG